MPLLAALRRGLVHLGLLACFALTGLSLPSEAAVPALVAML